MNFFKNKREEGSTLILALFTSLAIGMVLASYLLLISSRHKLTIRSMNWNAAIPILEAGIEEALTHLQTDSNSPSANGWTPNVIGGQPVFTKRRQFADGSYFNVTLYNAALSNPLIYSSGFVLSPLATNHYLSRTVRVTTTNPPSLFSKAIASGGTVTLGGNVLVDGFDSHVGSYDTSTNRTATGGIATDSTAAGAVNIGKGNVYGTVTTGPGGTISIAGGAIGDVAWNTSNSGIEPGWTNNNMNVSFPSNAPPSGGPFLAPTVTASGGSNIMYLGTGTKTLSAFSGSGSTPIIVTGNAVLWVTGDFSLSGGGYVQILPGASLTLYVGGSASLSGGGVINGTGLAANFTLIGLSSNTGVSFSGNADFVGTINAPQAAISLSGNAVVYGAVIGKTVSISGNPALHYDQALATPTGLMVTSWTEL